MNTELIGRVAEVEAVDRLLELARGALTSLLIGGDAGIGKTAIWRAAIALAAERGARVLGAAPAASERALTLGGLTDLLSTTSDVELASLPDVQRHALEIAILRAEPSGQLPDQRTLSVATATLLRQLANDRPLVLAIDDAQWLDEASAAILAYAIRRLVDRPIAVLLAVRGEPEPVVLESTAGVPTERREQLHVGP